MLTGGFRQCLKFRGAVPLVLALSHAFVSCPKSLLGDTEYIFGLSTHCSKKLTPCVLCDTIVHHNNHDSSSMWKIGDSISLLLLICSCDFYS